MRAFARADLLTETRFTNLPSTAYDILDNLNGTSVVLAHRRLVPESNHYTDDSLDLTYARLNRRLVTLQLLGLIFAVQDVTHSIP